MKQEDMAAQDVRILFNDPAAAVCVKPVGADSQRDMPALLQAQLEGGFFCVHRLDRDAGGIMVYARTAADAAALSRAIAEGRLEKAYLAVCSGAPAERTGELRDLLFHDAKRNKTFVVDRRRRGVREAALRYRVLAEHEGCSLVLIRLLTGRTHQIRVQFASRGLPLLGDAKYGSRIRTGGIALWSACLQFPHPRSGEPLCFSALPPQAGPWAGFPEEVLDDAQLRFDTEL